MCFLFKYVYFLILRKFIFDTGCWLLDTGYWILDVGYWILDTGCWLLDTGYWILDVGYCILDVGYWILDTGYWMLDTGYCWIPTIAGKSAEATPLNHATQDHLSQNGFLYDHAIARSTC